MRRRDFIKAVAGSAVTWPLTTRAQQAALPVIGWLKTAKRLGLQIPPLLPALAGEVIE